MKVLIYERKSENEMEVQLHLKMENKEETEVFKMTKKNN